MYRKKFIDLYLAKNFEFEEAKSEVDFVLETLFNFTYKDFILGKSLETRQILKAKKVFEERVNTHKPIQQIIGIAYFYGRKFLVNNSTLIPRPETELLVPVCLNCLKNISKPKILDIGCGSGCIGITLALENKFLKADALDICSDAIIISQKNALFHNIYESVNFFESDLFNKVNDKYNLIVSNPPYIPLKNRQILQEEVREFEPSTALFTKDELGIEFYEKIASQAKEFLSDNGFVVFECGINQSENITKILQSCNFRNISVKRDYNSIDRIVFAQK